MDFLGCNVADIESPCVTTPLERKGEHVVSVLSVLLGFWIPQSVQHQLSYYYIFRINLDQMELAASVIAVIQISGKVIAACTNYVLAVKDAKEDIERLQAEVETLCNVLKILEGSIGNDGGMAPSESATKMINGALQQCLSDLEHLEERLKPNKMQNVMKKFGKRAFKWPFSSKDVDKIVGTLERHKLTINLALNIDTRQDQQLTKLPYARDAAFNSALWQHEPSCLPGTRVELLQQIHEWSNSANGATIYWLCGMAGTGKSTISRTVAKQWHEQKRLGASFFFSRGQAELSNARNLFNTIAFHLSNALPALRTHISKAIRENPDIFHRGLSEQWQHLIIHPLSALNVERHTPYSTGQLIILIDALDECDEEQDVQTVIRLFGQLQSQINAIRIRVFITSRPELAIQLGFRKIAKGMHQDFVLQDIAVSIVQHDISLFLHHEFRNIRENRELPDGWPGHDTIERVTQNADESFIYAATVCRFIGDPKVDPRKNLPLVLGIEVQQNSAATRPLDAMYMKILQQSVFGESNAKEAEGISIDFKQSVGMIILLFDPLSTEALAALLHQDQYELGVLLNRLGSVISSEGRSIRLLHPSFRDFLQDDERCTDTRLWIDKNKTHNDIFLSCLNLMSTQLKRDICGLKWPGVLKSEIDNKIVKDCLPAAAQYACSHWVYHLEQCKSEFSNNTSHVLVFLKTHFLHWLEALSLIGKILDGVLALTTLESIIATKADEENNPDLDLFLRDAKRFLLRNRSIIEIAPLQIYCSALIFSPSKSIIRNQYQYEERVFTELRTMVRPEENDSLIQVCDDHTDDVNAIVFSPDGRLLASASDDETVRLWGPSTGACQHTLVGHTDNVNAIAFSPDSKLLASASDDNTVRLWDPSTGACQNTLEAHTAAVEAVAFSQVGNLLATGSYDKTVRLWDPSTGACQNTLEGHTAAVKAVAFSQDGKLLFSASSDNTIRLWDPSTGVYQKTLEGYSFAIKAAAFSPDGKLFVSALWCNTIRLWNSSTGACQYILEGHTDNVEVAAFSQDGKLLASASWDNTIRLWDPSTGASKHTFDSHTDAVTAVAFSPDGKLLASASDDKTVRLWDPSTGACRNTLDGHTGDIKVVTFSPDGKLLASASGDSTIRLWDPFTQASQSTLEGHTSTVTGVAFSQDGKLLASKSLDKTIRLWDSSTGESQNTLEGHSEAATAIAFSPDSKLLASASFDNTIRLWDSSTGECQHTLQGRTSTLVFSPDGRLLVSVSLGKVVRLWDTSKGACQNTLDSHTDDVTAVAFSPDGKLLASASEDKTIRLWDPSTGACQNILEGHTNAVTAIAFSPDGKLLASASSDKTIRLWYPSTGACRNILDGHTGSVRAVAFSQDGKFLATASSDQTTRLWDIRIAKEVQRFQTDTAVYQLSFSGHCRYLVTDQGNFTIDKIHFRHSTTPQGGTEYHGPLPISINNDWIQWRNTNLLWLPVDLRLADNIFTRLTSFRTRRNILAMGHPSGKVTILAFDIPSVERALQESNIPIKR